MAEDSTTPQLVAFVILICSSGFFSGLEIALSSLTAVDIHRIEEKGGYRKSLMALWQDHPGRVLTGILIGNNLVNVAAASIASVLSLKFAQSLDMNEALALSIATGVVTFLILILGEITPKTYAKQNSVFSVEILAAPLSWFLWIFAIPSYFLAKIAMVIIYILGGRSDGTFSRISDQDIRDMIRVGEREGIIKSHERQIMHSAFDFAATPVFKVMTPRMDIVALAYEATINDLMELIDERKFSRIPIYMDDLDNIIGVAYFKNALRFVKRNLTDVSVMECQVMPIYVPETKHIGDLLHEFQQKKAQLAIVFDEFGQTAGLVTLEDILEELVGEIWDEHEERGKKIMMLNRHQFAVEGSVEIDDLNKRLGLYIPANNFHTVAGWVNWTFGHIPKRFEQVSYDSKTTIRVLEVRRHKILKVLLIFNTDEAAVRFAQFHPIKKDQ